MNKDWPVCFEIFFYFQRSGHIWCQTGLLADAASVANLSMLGLGLGAQLKEARPDVRRRTILSLG